MGASQAFALEELLEGKGLVKKAGGLGLLTGLGARLTRASALPSSAVPRDPLPTTVLALDRLLSGGLPRGGFVELSGRRSCGRFSIGLATLASATSSGEAAALVDLGGHLDPQAAEEAGVDLTRLLWVRPQRLKHAVASAEMLLATGFPLVVVDLGLAPVRGRFLPDAAWVRLERAARDRRAALLLLAPYRISGVAAEAVVAADLPRAIWRGAGRGPRLLEGATSRLTLQKDARARTGFSEFLSLTTFTKASFPLPAPPPRGSGDFFGSEGHPGRHSIPSIESGIPRSARDDGVRALRGDGKGMIQGDSEGASVPRRHDSEGASVPRRHPEERSDEGSRTRQAAHAY